MALTLNTGGGTASLVQQSASWVAKPASPSLPAVSTTGNCLICVAYQAHGSFSASPPTGWIQLSQATGADNSIAIFAYPNNPGGIQIVTPIGPNNHLSEWANVDVSATLDSSGTTTATSGTTLAPTTAGNLAFSGDLAISCWVQEKSGVATATFTSPAGWTRLTDTGADATVDTHVDVEYKINPGTGAPLGPTLTSNRTTTFAAGAIVAIKAAAVAVDQSAYIEYGSLAVRQNTLDVVLVDPATVPSLGQAVNLTTPTWSGTLVRRKQSDIVNLRSGHQRVGLTATNVTAAPGGAAPWNLSDVPNGTTLRGYRDISLETSVGADGTVRSLVRCVVFDTGLDTGMSIQVTNSNLGLAAVAYTVQQISQTWIGLQIPAYLVELGDPFLTFAAAAGGMLRSSGAVLQQGIGIPGGVIGTPASITANQLAVGNLVDITGLTTTAQVRASRTIRVDAKVQYTKHTAGLLALDLFEGATQLDQWIVTAVDGASYTGTLATVLTPSAGAHTYKLTVGVSAGTADVIASSTNPAYIAIHDLG